MRKLRILSESYVYSKKSKHRKSYGKISIFAITQEGIVELGSSSNSTEIFMRLNCVENFITIWLSFRKLSCKAAGRTHWPIIVVYSLFFEYTIANSSWFLFYFCLLNLRLLINIIKYNHHLRLFFTINNH